MHLLPLILLACAGKAPPGDDSHTTGDDSPADDSADDTAEDTGYPEGLNGEIPDESIPAPDFNATNFDGGARSRPDLLGHRTVVWFFPAAGTFG